MKYANPYIPADDGGQVKKLWYLRPERVKEKCKVDKSIAIAHDLEHLYEEKATAPKKHKKSKK